MRSKLKFQLSTLLTAFTLCAVAVWSWTVWQRYDAVRLLMHLVDGQVPKSNEPIEAAAEEINRLRASEAAVDGLRNALDHPDYSVRHNSTRKS